MCFKSGGECPAGKCESITCRTLDIVAMELNKVIKLCQTDVQGAGVKFLHCSVETMKNGGPRNFLGDSNGQVLCSACNQQLERTSFFGYKLITSLQFSSLMERFLPAYSEF
jgi:hypothetical protein